VRKLLLLLLVLRLRNGKSLRNALLHLVRKLEVGESVLYPASQVYPVLRLQVFHVAHEGVDAGHRVLFRVLDKIGKGAVPEKYVVDVLVDFARLHRLALVFDVAESYVQQVNQNDKLPLAAYLRGLVPPHPTLGPRPGPDLRIARFAARRRGDLCLRLRVHPVKPDDRLAPFAVTLETVRGHRRKLRLVVLLKFLDNRRVHRPWKKLNVDVGPAVDVPYLADKFLLQGAVLQAEVKTGKIGNSLEKLREVRLKVRGAGRMLVHHFLDARRVSSLKFLDKKTGRKRLLAGLVRCFKEGTEIREHLGEVLDVVLGMTFAGKLAYDANPVVEVAFRLELVVKLFRNGYRMFPHGEHVDVVGADAENRVAPENLPRLAAPRSPLLLGKNPRAKLGFYPLQIARVPEAVYNGFQRPGFVFLYLLKQRFPLPRRPQHPNMFP